MADIGDVFHVTLTGTTLGQQWVNSFFYRLEDVPSAGHMAGLATEFDSRIVGYMSDALMPSVTFDQISIRNLWTGDELVTLPSDRVGTRTVSSEALPSFVAAHCKLVRGNNRVRHGHKYVCGLAEIDASGNMWTASTMAWLNILASRFAEQLYPGAVDAFKPIVVGRVWAPKKSGTGNAWRLPETPAEMGDRWAYVVAAAFTNDVTTMRSRKASHGN